MNNTIFGGTTATPVPPEVLEPKQEVLKSGENIKTINGKSILGEGNIEIDVDLSKYYTKAEIDGQIGDIETALDSIIAIQESLIGGDGE